jgi:formylglycine-generating enzyme required for sulfatase activity
MKSTQAKYYFIVAQLFFLGACNLRPTATVPTVLPSESSATPILETIDLAGPRMEVGSTFLYADGTTLVAVPAGTFTMGADGADNPQHQVNLSDFWIYSTKVTNGQYAYCVEMGQCTPLQLQANNPTFDDLIHTNDPMVGVDYDQAAAYCSFVHARLPTEAEWEKATRGPEGNIYPWGDGAPSCDLLNYETCVGSPTSVTNYPNGRSYYQAFDMEGNTLEWVADWYQADYYPNSPTDNPQGPDKGIQRSVRSSAFNSGANQTQAFNRFYSSPDTQRNNLGFRCVVEAEDIAYFAPFCDYPAAYGTDGIGGAATGPQSVVSCPDIVITHNAFCQNGRQINTFAVTGGPIYTMETTCDQGSNMHFTCDKKNDFFSACIQCKTTLTSPPQCPQGYTFDSQTNKCASDISNSTGTCLPGFTLGVRGIRGSNITTTLAPSATNTVGQCCAFTPPQLTEPTTDGSVVCISNLRNPNPACTPDFPSCPAGTSFDGQQCISVTASPMTCKQETLVTNSCSSGGNSGDGNGCPNTCSPGQIQDPTTCQCRCTSC